MGIRGDYSQLKHVCVCVCIVSSITCFLDKNDAGDPMFLNISPVLSMEGQLQVSGKRGLDNG